MSGARANTPVSHQDRLARAQQTTDKSCHIASVKGSFVGVLAAESANFWTDFIADVAAAVRETTPSDVRSCAEIPGKLELLHGVADAFAKQLKKDEATADKDAYDKWVEQSLSGGAGAAHMLCRAALDEDNVEQAVWENENTTCPTARLATDREKWKDLWGATDCLCKGEILQDSGDLRAARCIPMG